MGDLTKDQRKKSLNEIFLSGRVYCFEKQDVDRSGLGVYLSCQPSLRVGKFRLNLDSHFLIMPRLIFKETTHQGRWRPNIQ